MIKSVPRWLLIFLLFFNAIGAFYGSYHFLTDPTGDSLQAPLDMLNGSIFEDFFIPGILLLLVNGILPTVAGLGLILRRPQKPLPGFAMLNNHHWAWSLALLSGLGLVIWIVVQIAMLGYWKAPPIQAVFGGLGLAITALTLLQSVRSSCSLTINQ